MPTEIVMPNLGFDTQEGLLIEWLKQPGDFVKKGEVIAIIESDKANVELESVASGDMLEQLFLEGDKVPIGAAIARIGSQAEVDTGSIVSPPGSTPSTPIPVKIEATPIAKRLARENNVDLAQVSGSGKRGRIKREDVEAFLANLETAVSHNGISILALPKVRKAAREASIDLAQVEATGSRGNITLADLQAYQSAQAAARRATDASSAAPQKVEAITPQPTSHIPSTANEVPISRARQIIGKRLGESKRAAPHFYVTGEFDLEGAIGRLQSMPAPYPRLNDLIQYLTVQTLRRVPELNATLEDGRLYQHTAINLAIAVAREDGLITPVLHEADRYSITGLAAESRQLVQRARANRLSPESLQGGTFTISNLGIMKQVDRFTAVINPPQVAILAVGTIKQRPQVINGGLHIRHTVNLTLSGDHRVVDGVNLGHFMSAFQKELNFFAQG